MYYSKEDKDLLTFLIGQETAKKRERDQRVGGNVLVIACDEPLIKTFNIFVRGLVLVKRRTLWLKHPWMALITW